MATRDEMMSALRGAHEAGDTEAATRIASMLQRTSEPAQTPAPARQEPSGFIDSATSALRNAGTALATGAGHVGATLLSPADLAYDIYKGQPGGTSSRQRRAAIDQFGNENADTESLNYQGFNMLPEVAATGGGIAKTGEAIAARMLPRALGRYAPAAGDIIANAAYEGGKSIARGDNLEAAAGNAAAGGAGAAGGRVLTRALGGIKPLVTKEAQQLIERGVYPTPGQALGGVAASLEDKALSLPIVGDIGTIARRRSIGDFGRAETNAVLESLPGAPKVTGSGIDAVEAAQKKISSVYDDALDGMSVQPGHIDSALQDTVTALKGGDIPLLDEAQAQKVANYIGLRIAPLSERGALSGTQAKAIDAEMGHYARKFSRSINPSDHPLGDAFYTLQGNWREAMARGATPEKTQMLNAANEAYRGLLPIVKASDKAMAQGGTFTPLQLARSTGPYGQQPSDLTRAAQSVLPSRVPDSGSAGRLLLGALAGGAGTAGAGLGPTAAAGGLAYVLSSRQGLKMLYEGMGGLLPDATKQYLASLPPDKALQYMAHLHQTFPHLREGMARSAQQAAAQIGRHLATQQQPEEATQ